MGSPETTYTSSPIAETQLFRLPHIGKDKIDNMDEVIDKSMDDKISLMREVFNSLTGKQLQIIEQDENAGNHNNVILRNEAGKGIGRLGHGTLIEAVSHDNLISQKNTNGFRFKEMKDTAGRKRIYVNVSTETGKAGYVALEHIGIVPSSTPPSGPIAPASEPSTPPTTPPSGPIAPASEPSTPPTTPPSGPIAPASEPPTPPTTPPSGPIAPASEPSTPPVIPPSGPIVPSQASEAGNSSESSFPASLDKKYENIFKEYGTYKANLGETPVTLSFILKPENGLIVHAHIADITVSDDKKTVTVHRNGSSSSVTFRKPE